MKRFFSFLVVLSMLVTCLADNTVVAVGEDNKTNVGTVIVPDLHVVTNTLYNVSFKVIDGSRTFDVMFPDDTFPTNKTFIVIASEDYVNEKVNIAMERFDVYGGDELYKDYTNAPPTTPSSMTNYLYKAVKILGNVTPQSSINSFTGRLSRVEDVAAGNSSRIDSIIGLGGGTTELDSILEQTVDELTMDQILKNQKMIVKMIKYGTTTNTVPNTTSSTQEDED